METTVINVEGMSCEHCVRAITTAVGDLDGVDEVAVDLAKMTATVTYDIEKVSLGKIIDEIEDQGYDVL